MNACALNLSYPWEGNCFGKHVRKSNALLTATNISIPAEGDDLGKRPDLESLPTAGSEDLN